MAEAVKTFFKNLDENKDDDKNVWELLSKNGHNFARLIAPEGIDKMLNGLKTFKVRKSDVWVATFPKSGEL